MCCKNNGSKYNGFVKKTKTQKFDLENEGNGHKMWLKSSTWYPLLTWMKALAKN